MKLDPLPPEEDWIVRRFATIEQTIKESAFSVLNSAPMAKWVNTREAHIGINNNDWHEVGKFDMPRLPTGYGILIIGLATGAYQMGSETGTRMEWQLSRNRTEMTSGMMLPGSGGGATGPVGGLALSVLSDPASYAMSVKRSQTTVEAHCNAGMLVGVPVRLS